MQPRSMQQIYSFHNNYPQISIKLQLTSFTASKTRRTKERILQIILVYGQLIAYWDLALITH